MTQTNPTLQAADVLAQAVRELIDEYNPLAFELELLHSALAAYERAKADEAKPVCKHDIPLTVRCDWCESETKPVAADIYAALNYYRNADFLTTEQQKIAEDALMQIDPSELTDRHAPELDSRDSAITAKELLAWVQTFVEKSWIYEEHAGIIEHYLNVFKTERAAMTAETNKKP